MYARVFAAVPLTRPDKKPFSLQALGFQVHRNVPASMLTKSYAEGVARGSSGWQKNSAPTDLC